MVNEIVTDVERRRNFRLYTQGIDDGAKARWEGTQGPKTAEAKAVTLGDVKAWLTATYGSKGEGWNMKQTSEKWLGRDVWDVHVMEPTSPTEPAAANFLDEARAFLVEEAKADRIKAGELIYGDNDMQRATATVIDAAGKEKHVVLKRSKNGIKAEDYTPLLGTATAAEIVQAK